MGRRRRRRQGRPAQRWLRRLLALPLLFIIVTATPVLLLRWLDPPTSAFMLAYRLDADAAPLRQQWRDLDAIAPVLPLAVIAAEDQRFPEHRGFDVASIRQALAERGERLRGASTISQQVAKNLFLWSGRSWVRKGLEAWFTVLLEALWPKQRILEVHLNIAEFGPGIYGAEAAAQALFGKPAARLSADEAALLAAVLPNPARLSALQPSAHVRRRQAWILRQMRQLGGPAYLSRLD